MKKISKIKLPDKPGVYLFKRNRDILYIGKATSLRNRVKSYMSKTVFDTRGPLIEKMIQETNKIDFQITDNVLEALILEVNLIKKYQPKYNSKEKDDKSFNYVCITKEKLPKVIIARGSNVKHRVFGKIYGPYISGTQLKEAMKIIRRIFPFLDEKSKNYLEFYKQINLIPNIVGKRSFLKEEQSDGEVETLRKQYLKNIQNLKLFFEGKKKRILKNLEKEMKDYAKKKEFEKAGEIKRQIFALKHINDVALIKNNSEASNEIFDPAPNFPRIPGNKVGPSDAKISLLASLFRIEAYDIAHMGGKNMVGVMAVVDLPAGRQEIGEVNKNEYKRFKIRTQNNANDIGALKEVLERRFKHSEWVFPNLIVVDGGIAQTNVTKNVLKKIGINIPVVSVLKDERHKPKAIMGDKKFGLKYKREILLANSEAHRFAINYHKNMRNKNFLK